jgi:hypothetical protein
MKINLRQIAVLGTILLIAFALSAWSEPKLRHFIQFLYQCFSSNKIQFSGKEFHLFASNEYYIFSTILIAMLLYLKQKISVRNILKYTLVEVLVFFISLTAICFFDSSIKLAVCTLCSDGIRIIGYGDLKYEAIIIVSLFVTLIPVLARYVRSFLRLRAQRKLAS